MGANNKVFVDTWAWLSIANGNDNYHETAKECLDDISSQKGLLPLKSYKPLFYELFAFQNILAIKEGKKVF